MTMSTMKLEMLFTVTAVELRSIGKMEFIFVHIAVRPNSYSQTDHVGTEDETTQARALGNGL